MSQMALSSPLCGLSPKPRLPAILVFEIRGWQTIASGPNPAPDFLNKFLWEKSHTHLFTYDLWLLS